MKEWRFTERSKGCGLANRQFFEVPETGKLKPLQKKLEEEKGSMSQWACDETQG